jgi:diguanylate cyclase (GGDEF)-like protein
MNLRTHLFTALCFAFRLSRLLRARHFLAVTWIALLAVGLPDGPARWVFSLVTAIAYLAYELTKKHADEVADEQRQIGKTAHLNLATLEALARAVDAKSHTSSLHLARVQLYASRLAATVRLSSDELHATMTAALLHDIGKVAVPEHVLSKPGPLTPEEFEKVKIHPAVGADIMSMVPFPYPVAPLILSHHERWDGGGYPQGLAGEDIPIGARILSVVDFYDSITANRPYHAALSHDSAVNLMRYEAGKALDPTLVSAFLNLLPSIQSDVAFATATAPAPSAVRGLTSGGVDTIAHVPLARLQILALYDIAQSMGTSLSVSETMELISSKLGSLVPWSGCALYVTDRDSDTLRCRFAVGVGAPTLLHTSVGPGEGPVAWVAANRRTLVNASPHSAFEAAGVPADHGLLSSLICPLALGNAPVGCLVLFHRDLDTYTEDHRRLIEQVAEQAGAVIHNAMVFEQTQRDSLTDALTLLPNRRYMLDYVAHEIARADRIQGQVAVIVLDIDQFKPINDIHGHHVGDRTLREVASALKNGLRSYDLCVRYGGDEFVVVLAECSRDAAEEKHLELEERLSQIAVDVPYGSIAGIKASAGISVYPHDGATVDELLATADRRMYRDKARSHVEADPLQPDAQHAGFTPGLEPDILSVDQSNSRQRDSAPNVPVGV